MATIRERIFQYQADKVAALPEVAAFERNPGETAPNFEKLPLVRMHDGAEPEPDTPQGCTMFTLTFDLVIFVNAPDVTDKIETIMDDIYNAIYRAVFDDQTLVSDSPISESLADDIKRGDLGEPDYIKANSPHTGTNTVEWIVRYTTLDTDLTKIG
jgi:hypothetical protein